MTKCDKIDRVPILKRSGNYEKALHRIPDLKRGSYRVEQGYSISGDAPKEYIRVYEYKKGVFKSKPKTWPLYIAKTGHKWYPVESIIEQLNSDLGRILGFSMADSKLVMENAQLRFLSKFFLKEDETLEHGANIMSGYLGDKDFFNNVEKLGYERELITVQEVKRALEFKYPKNGSSIFNSFVKMLIFDALIGINDRHFYNWGVIESIRGGDNIRFSPIYDSARSLFWNFPDERIAKLEKDVGFRNQSFEKYIEKSRPKLSVQGLNHPSHFSLLERLIQTTPTCKPFALKMSSNDNKRRVETFIESNYGKLLGKSRTKIILEYLSLRFSRFRQVAKAT